MAKARLTYGLIHVLRYNVDCLRIDVVEFDPDNIMRTIKEVNETLDKITDTVAQLEYLLYMYKLDES